MTSYKWKMKNVSLIAVTPHSSLLSPFILHPSSFFFAFTALAEIGRLFIRSHAFVGQASHDKEQIGEAVEVPQRSQIDLFARRQGNDCTFGPPRDCSRQV